MGLTKVLFFKALETIRDVFPACHRKSPDFPPSLHRVVSQAPKRWSISAFFFSSLQLVSTPSVLFLILVRPATSRGPCNFWHLQPLQKSIPNGISSQKKGAQIPNPPRRFHFEVRRDFEVEVLRATKKKARITEIQQKPGTHLKFFG